METDTSTDRYLGTDAVKKRYGNISDMTVDRWIAKGILPPPDYFGRLRMWKLSKLEANERSLARQGAPRRRK
jgi:hypothetical protein